MATRKFSCRYAWNPELDVYDKNQDQEKSVFQQLYEALAGGVSEVLENIPRREVAAQADIAGPLDNPQASTWQVVVTLIQNAFFKAILPGFERELGRGGRGTPPPSRTAGGPLRVGLPRGAVLRHLSLTGTTAPAPRTARHSRRGSS
jgi:hypothetical protein